VCSHRTKRRKEIGDCERTATPLSSAVTTPTPLSSATSPTTRRGYTIIATFCPLIERKNFFYLAIRLIQSTFCNLPTSVAATMSDSRGGAADGSGPAEPAAEVKAEVTTVRERVARYVMSQLLKRRACG
jgi:hypothetical protein